MKFLEFKKEIENINTLNSLNIYTDEISVIKNGDEYYIKSIEIKGRTVIFVLSENLPKYTITINTVMSLVGLDNYVLKIRLEDSKQLIKIDRFLIKIYTEYLTKHIHFIIEEENGDG